MSYFYKTVPNRKFKCSSFCTCNMLEAYNPRPICDDLGFNIRNCVFLT